MHKNKALLAFVLSTGIACTPEVTPEGSSYPVVDGQALVMAMRKSTGLVSFGK